jgi:hypothetical protein
MISQSLSSDLKTLDTSSRNHTPPQKVELYPATTLHTKRVLFLLATAVTTTTNTEHISTRHVVCHALPITAGGGEGSSLPSSRECDTWRRGMRGGGRRAMRMSLMLWQWRDSGGRRPAVSSSPRTSLSLSRASFDDDDDDAIRSDGDEDDDNDDNNDYCTNVASDDAIVIVATAIRGGGEMEGRTRCRHKQCLIPLSLEVTYRIPGDKNHLMF